MCFGSSNDARLLLIPMSVWQYAYKIVVFAQSFLIAPMAFVKRLSSDRIFLSHMKNGMMRMVSLSEMSCVKGRRCYNRQKSQRAKTKRRGKSKSNTGIDVDVSGQCFFLYTYQFCLLLMLGQVLGSKF
jgi:hypothetical protein